MCSCTFARYFPFFSVCLSHFRVPADSELIRQAERRYGPAGAQAVRDMMGPPVHVFACCDMLEGMVVVWIIRRTAEGNDTTAKGEARLAGAVAFAVRMGNQQLTKSGL